MATITIRIDDADRDAIEDLAKAQGMNLSELLRGQVDVLLGRSTARPGAPQTLDMTQRRTLVLLHEILQRLPSDDPDTANYHQRHAEALAHGYTGEYPDEFAGIFPELPRADCELAWDILDMFNVLRGSIDRLSPEALLELGRAAETTLVYGGLDFNDATESTLATYIGYMIDAGKWPALADRFGPEHDRGNSHSRRLPRYQRMLEAFQPIWKDYLASNRGVQGLDLQELQRIAEAAS